MEASQLKISPENLRFKPMSRKKKLELRRENIKALIRSKPAGTVISIAQFAAACAQTEGNTFAMMKTMIKHGEIVKIPSEGHKKRYSWAVNDGNVISPAVKKAIEAAAPKLDVALLIEKAKEFVWQEDSDSLRAFVKWIEGEKKHARGNLPTSKPAESRGDDKVVAEPVLRRDSGEADDRSQA